MGRAAFSPDGQRIVTGSSDRTAKVWDAATGKEVFTLKGHSGYAFSRDGNRIVTASDDQTAKVWDAVTGLEALALKPADAVGSVAFSPDGRWIATGIANANATVKLWYAAPTP